jgi:hypothetical protein
MGHPEFIEEREMYAAAAAVLAGFILSMLSFTAQAADTTNQTEAAALVQELREFPPALGPSVNSNGTIVRVEQRRKEIYERLRQLNSDAIPALSRGLKDPDVRIRRNVTLVLAALAGNWYERAEPRLDIRSYLPTLVEALGDSDSLVRARAAHAIGEIGGEAVTALPSLLTLLKYPDEASRIGACIALRGIGPVAGTALPTLRRALDDPSKDVRQFAGQAIASIQGRSSD